MAFANTDSIAAADVNNMLRGLHRNNADSAHTGDTNETDLSSTSITGATIGATGSIHVMASGGTTGTTDTKTIKFFFGSTNIGTVSIAGGSASAWAFDVWIYNTATGAQRIFYRAYEGVATLESIKNTSSSIDTTASVTVKCTATLGGTTDTITQSTFNIDIVQRT